MIPAPAELSWLAEPLGEAALLSLIERFGGARLYVPKKPSRELVRVLGAEPAAALCSAFGGNELTVPLAKNWRIRLYSAAGRSGPEIARALSVSEDTVWRALRYSQAGRDQLSFNI